MIKKFTISNFKCFEGLMIQQWERINLIAGKNNVGKTSLLEAIFLHEGAHNAGLALTIEGFRGIMSFNDKDFLSDLFAEFDANRMIELETEYDNEEPLLLKVTQKETGAPRPYTGGAEVQGTASISPRVVFEGLKNDEVVCSSEVFLGVDPSVGVRPFVSAGSQVLRPTTIFVSTGISKERKNEIDMDRFSAQVEAKKKKEIVDSLKVVDNRLQNLDQMKRGNRDIIGGDIGYKKLVPLSLMGEGMERYLSFVLAILSAENGIVLIDEIDNGFHHSIHSKIWSNLAKLARKYNVQIIATTHSYECIEAAHKSFKEDEKYDFILHRLDRVGERIEDVTYDKETLEAAINMNLEVR